MYFSLDVLRARRGDCLMLHYGTADNPHLILIDGGPSGVYKPQLKPRLARIHRSRGLQEEEPLPVDVVMVSHVDDDHIEGILELAQEQRHVPDLRLGVTSLWHNGFDDLLDTKPEELEFEAGLRPAAPDDGGDEDGDALDAAKVLASIPQGRQLRDDAEALGWKANYAFQEELILATRGAEAVTLDGGLKLTVVGPMRPEVLALQKAHDRWLRQQDAKRRRSPGAVPAAFSDKSVPNLSSIVVLADLGGKRVLLTGDARGDKILEGLELVGLLRPGRSVHVDVLKLPHHGSDRNMETGFFRRVTADHYVFSGDGEHGNPKRATLEMLLEARGEAPFTLHFTYPIEEIDAGRKAEWEEQQGKERRMREKKPETKVREAWSDEEHSLKALLEQRPAPGQEISVVADGKPHLIHLLDPIDL